MPMWFSHLLKLLLRNWNRTTTAYGTTTLGFLLWVVLFTILLWLAGVLGTWATLRKTKQTSLKEVLMDSSYTGMFSVGVIAAIAVISYAAFLLQTVYQDHQTLTAQVEKLSLSNHQLNEEIERRKHALFPDEPAF